MKALICIFVTLLSLSTFGQVKIGIINNGRFEITYDLSVIKTEAQALLVSQGINTTLSSFEILEDVVEGTQQIYYMLLCKNSDQSIKLATELKLHGKEFQKISSVIFASSCVCTGCSKGCSPRHHNDDGIIEWMCSPCKSSGGCIKSESASN